MCNLKHPLGAFPRICCEVKRRGGFWPRLGCSRARGVAEAHKRGPETRVSSVLTCLRQRAAFLKGSSGRIVFRLRRTRV